MDSIARLKAWTQENRQRLIDELLAFLSQPSVSTTGLGIEETVRILQDELDRLLHSLKNASGRIQIPGYTDDMEAPTTSELELLKSIPFDPDAFCRQYGISEILAEGSPVEQLRALLFEPTCNISGIKSGWVGEKAKTIIPADATAILDFRLVKGQPAQTAADKITRFIEDSPYGPFEFTAAPVFEPYQCPPENPWAQLATSVAQAVTNQEPVVWPLLDGSGPLCWFHQYLAAPTFIIGLGAPFETANTHAPNENIGIDQYLTGIVQMATLFYRSASTK